MGGERGEGEGGNDQRIRRKLTNARSISCPCRFVLPCTLVIVNDIMAYFAGKMFGRTPLIKLSPKKTLEGFIGGGAFTILVSIPISELMSNYQWMTCSRTSFAKDHLECRYKEAFEETIYHFSDFVPGVVMHFVGSFVASIDFSFVMKPIIFHGKQANPRTCQTRCAVLCSAVL